MKVYISGKIGKLDAGNYDEVKQKFADASVKVWNAGYVPVNPFALGNDYIERRNGATWADVMKYDLHLLLDCDAIYMLPDWRESAGAKIEYYVAKSLGMMIIYEHAETDFWRELRAIGKDNPSPSLRATSASGGQWGEDLPWEYEEDRDGL